MLFLNRTQELIKLESIVNSRSSSLVVIWGRRRVGKTRLLLEWLKKHKKGFYWVADESSATIQRRYFALALENYLNGFSQVEYPDWQSFFARLVREAKLINWRGPIVIDEFPYLVAASPELPSILQRFIDHDAKEANLIIVLSGSSQHMMQGLILDPNAPLYGRAKEIIKIAPIAHFYISDALNIQDPIEQLKAYSLWGGIPRYWELAQKYNNKLLESIDHLVLDSQGILYDEPNRLLLEETPTIMSLRPILDVIGSGANKLSEIAARLNQPATSLSRPLERLKELDFIVREIPFGASEVDTKRSIYKIKDQFLYFWFKLVASKKSILTQLESSARIQWLKEVITPIWEHSWECLCRSLIHLYINKFGAHFNNTIFEPAKRFWHGNGPEWDLVARSLDHKSLLIGEIKWSNKIITESFIKDSLSDLLKKGIPNNIYTNKITNLKIYYIICVPKKPKKDIKLQDNVIILEAKDLFVKF